MPDALTVVPVPGIPEVRTGDDLAALVVAAITAAGPDVVDGDVVVVSSKVASKALGLWGDDRDAAVRKETVRVVAERETGGRVTRVVEAAAGPVMAAAGIDASNTGTSPRVLLLPRDPDQVCADLRRRLRAGLGVDRLGVVLTDTAGRPWRAGQVDIAVGAAGFAVLDDLRGGLDADGRPLVVTARAVADEVAAAAELVKGKAERVPVAVVRGLGRFVVAGGQGARSLVRTGRGDWFAMGHAEAVRAALGVAPGTARAAEAGIPSSGEEPVASRLARAVAVALAERELLPTVGVDAGPDWVVVTGTDPVERGMAAARLCVALWGEGLLGTVDRTGSGADALTVRLMERDAPTR